MVGEGGLRGIMMRNKSQRNAIVSLTSATDCYGDAA